MRRKILLFASALAGLAILLTSFSIHLAVYWDYLTMMKQEVRLESEYLKAGVEMAGLRYLSSLNPAGRAGETSLRITLIAQDGVVLFDTAGREEPENHLLRPEVQKALAAGRGEESRFSETLEKQTYYFAQRLEGGGVLRTSKTIDSVFLSLIQPILITILIALLIFAAAALVSFRVTRRLVDPINRLDLDNPENNDAYEELTPLLSRLKKQKDMIAAQLEKLRKQQLEFAAITDNMREGLIVLDQEASILSCTKSALKLLGIKEKNIAGKNALIIRRDPAFRAVVEKAASGASAETILSGGLGHLQIFANPVADGGNFLGAVLLILDVTERQDREKLRREFSANVSHELKTPLMAISGFAEIMAQGIAKPGDAPRLAASIYAEAQRLINLIEDILLLSKLDEKNEPLPREPVELSALTQSVMERLGSQAAAKGLSVVLDTRRAEITGIRQILTEMIFNLLDNAVKYNVRGGTIHVSIETTENEIIYSVADSGAGIPPGEEERIFERFYRVDKSRSKAAGGTGLGLSIVKHGAVLHGAKVEVESGVQGGARFILRFPRQPG
jgi:two-component system phosphate regulon sensor histidine kinase PhoR